jgi:DNA-binding NtrC family response regulator
VATDLKKLEKLFHAYITPRKIVIADESAAARTGLAKTLIDLGAKSTNIGLASSLHTAEEEMKRLKPHVVLCDYDLGKGCGLNLLQQQRKLQTDVKESLFIMVTGNTSQSAVAQAAEEDVDTFIIKPYTIETIRQSLLKAAIAKIYPSDYMKTVEEGKKLLFGGKVDESIPILEKAMTMSAKYQYSSSARGSLTLLIKAIGT